MSGVAMREECRGVLLWRQASIEAGTKEESRTPKSVSSHGPEPCASTNSATLAHHTESV